MTTNQLVDKLLELLQDLEGADVGRISDENCIGVDIDGKTWFVSIEEA